MLEVKTMMNDDRLLLKMTPRDLIFCRDARPMEDSWSGSGGHLPTPLTFHGALLAEYYRRFPEETELRESERISAGLRTWGPFLGRNGELYFQTPLDVAPGNRLLEVRSLDGFSDLPPPLCYGLFAPAADKRHPDRYISCGELAKYLSGRPFESTPESEFHDLEVRPGITISPDSRTVVKHAYYSAEYLRLRPGVTLNAAVCMAAGSSLGSLFDGEHRSLPLGGQQSLMYVEALPGRGIDLPEPQICGKLVKWALLTPTLWSRGWLPDFVDPSPDAEWNVLLRSRPATRPERLAGETRAEYRKRTAGEPIMARLVAARVGKPRAVSGWKMGAEGAPRATRMLVPAGSVYYFEARDEESARLLAGALHGRTLSDFGGTSGFGFGVCGSFEINR